jgi:hypothetical protein
MAHQRISSGALTPRIPNPDANTAIMHNTREILARVISLISELTNRADGKSFPLFQ